MKYGSQVVPRSPVQQLKEFMGGYRFFPYSYHAIFTVLAFGFRHALSRFQDGYSSSKLHSLTNHHPVS